ncbi:hypothetical protein F7725_002731, partial [Dissostichus mawsoni]
MYCWECLLFATDRFGVWSHTGFANFSCLTKAATRHQSTAGHLQAMVLLKTFGDTRKRVALKEVFDHILEHHEEYDGDTMLSADGFNARLDDFEFCFLLETFNGIFKHSDVLFGILQKQTL